MAYESLSSSAYYQILQHLMDRSFPADRRISESALARQLGISRTPVREALSRLESEGVIYQVVGSGTFLSQPDRQQIIEAYEVREALECQAAAHATRKMTSEERIELQLQCDNMHAAIRAFRDSGGESLGGEPLKQYLVADLKFHLLLLRAADNRTAMKIVADRRIRDSVFGDSSHRRNLTHLAKVWRLHSRIARAVSNNDPKGARYWMRKHIRTSLQDALTALEDWESSKHPRGTVPSEVSALLEDVVKDLARSRAPRTSTSVPGDLPLESSRNTSRAAGGN